MSDEQVLLYERSGRVVTLTINRPDARNALSPAVVSAMLAALRRAGDEDTGCVVITGAGDRSFCAGGDLGAGGMMTPDTGVVGAHELRGEFAELLRTLVGAPFPSVARVQGHALGGGFGLAAACDITIAVESATFGTPEIRVGLFPMMIMAVLARAAGRKRALELMLVGDRIDARKAEHYGFVNQVVAADELDAEVARIAEKLAGHSPVAMKLGRRAFQVMSDMELDKALEYLNGMLSLTLLTDDAMEGISAFIEKRPPEWKGR